MESGPGKIPQAARTSLRGDKGKPALAEGVAQRRARRRTRSLRARCDATQRYGNQRPSGRKEHAKNGRDKGVQGHQRSSRATGRPSDPARTRACLRWNTKRQTRNAEREGAVMSERTQVRAAAAAERVSEVAVAARARHAALDFARLVVRRRTRTRGRGVGLRRESRLDEVVVLLLVKEDLAQAARAVLARAPGPLDVAVLALDDVGRSRSASVKRVDSSIVGVAAPDEAAAVVKAQSDAFAARDLRVGKATAAPPSAGGAVEMDAAAAGSSAEAGRLSESGAELAVGLTARICSGSVRNRQRNVSQADLESRKRRTGNARTAPSALLAPANPTRVNSPRSSSLVAASPRTSNAPPGASEGSMRARREAVTRLAGRRTTACL